MISSDQIEQEERARYEARRRIEREDTTRGRVAGWVGVVLAVLGALMPVVLSWAFFVPAIILGAIAFARGRRVLGCLVLALCALDAAFAVYQWSEVSNDLDELSRS